MKRILSPWLCILLASCGTPKKAEKKPDRDWDPALIPILTDFLKVYPVDVSNLELLVFTDELSKPETVGNCKQIISSKGDRNEQVRILSPEFWPYEPTESDIRWVVYHELGHCLLNLGHSTSENSIMTSVVPLDTSNVDELLPDIHDTPDLTLHSELDLCPIGSHLHRKDLHFIFWSR